MTARAVLLVCLASITSSTSAEIVGTTLVANVGTSLYAVADPLDPNQMFIAQRDGVIRRLNLETGSLSSPFLSISGVSTAGEGGLLGLALHPDHAENGLGYVYYTTASGGFQSRIAEFQRDPDDSSRALPGVDAMLSFAQPQSNHNGGWIGFSPMDDYLYIASGDGGGSNDLGAGHTASIGNSQDITGNLLGKMLRIDVNGDDFPLDASRNYAIPADNPFVGTRGDDEIWAYGLRNPFRNGFDSATGDLWIADVGQNSREEINFQPGTSDGGENYGWRLREGTIATPSGGVGGPAPTGAIDPVYEYLHGSGSFRGNSTTGGTVYRGPDPDLQGLYFFADFARSNFWTFDPSNPSGTVDNINAELAAGSSDNSPVAFPVDAAGNLYILTIGGNLLRIDTTPAGDYDNDGDVDTADYNLWRTTFGSTTNLAADGNNNGIVDAADYTVWRDTLGESIAAATIPEPASALALGVAISTAAIARRRRR